MGCVCRPRGLTGLVDRDATGHWTHYWRQGHLTSLPCGFESNYDGEFLTFWNAQFAALDKGAVVLDVCSGNGSIALLAQEFSARNELGLQVQAVDAAGIEVAPLIAANPAYATHVRAIRFITDTPLEQLELPAVSVDLVTSQFGIEYTDWAAAAGVVTRVLQPGGHFALLCHTPESRILPEMERQCRDYDSLYALEVFSGALAADVGSAPPDEVRQRLNGGLDSIFALFKDDRASVLLGGLGRTLENIYRQSATDFDAAMRNYLQLQRQVDLSRGIARDLLAVHHALRAAPQWHDAFVAAGLARLDSGVIRHHTGDIAGRWHRFRKTDA